MKSLTQVRNLLASITRTRRTQHNDSLYTERLRDEASELHHTHNSLPMPLTEIDVPDESDYTVAYPDGKVRHLRGTKWSSEHNRQVPFNPV